MLSQCRAYVSPKKLAQCRPKGVGPMSARRSWHNVSPKELAQCQPKGVGPMSAQRSLRNVSPRELAQCQPKGIGPMSAQRILVNFACLPACSNPCARPSGSIYQAADGANGSANAFYISSLTQVSDLRADPEPLGIG